MTTLLDTVKADVQEFLRTNQKLMFNYNRQNETSLIQKRNVPIGKRIKDVYVLKSTLP